MTALIIDTISIQPYIFGSNKLRENIGGSFIIEYLVYGHLIPEALFSADIDPQLDINAWESASNRYRLLDDQEARVEIGYIGGGNALLIFRKEADSDLFIKKYSELLLTHFPGLNTAFGKHKFSYDAEVYKSFRKELNSKLIYQRHVNPVRTLPQKHGIEADCAWTNEAQEFYDRQTGTWVSSMSFSRINMLDAAQRALSEQFAGLLGSEYTFTNDLGGLGQPAEKGYIAIVHADGNGMGARFMACNSLEETRELSYSVKKYASEVMTKLISYVIEHKEKLNYEDWDSDAGFTNNILPIRPLIIGGDDITFVCEGRLGVHLAEKLLHFMSTTAINGQTIAACAGIAIVHTKYPFYKAYQLTEELTKKAKQKSRDNGDSWLHYMISTSGFSGSYDMINRDQFTIRSSESGERTLKYGPYCLSEVGKRPISKLKSGMKALLEIWPRNKQKELRDILRKDQASEDYFLAEIKARQLRLPDGSEKIWDNKETPYYDMVELLDFYPTQLL
jgi:hypothetical protein